MPTYSVSRIKPNKTIQMQFTFTTFSRTGLLTLSSREFQAAVQQKT